MENSTNSINDFGLLIAYVVPGMAFLLGCSYFTPELATWFSVSFLQSSSFSSFLLLTVASITAGLTVHTIRWITIDALLRRSGVRPKWDMSKLSNNLSAFDKLTEYHFRYHQFYGGMVISLIWIFVARHIADTGLTLDWLDLAFTFLSVLFLVASRDSLRKFYDRTNAMITRA